MTIGVNPPPGDPIKLNLDLQGNPLPPGDDFGTGVKDPVPTRDPATEIADILATFPWIAELGEAIISVIVAGILNADPHSVITQSIRNTDVYKRRFAGLVQRQSNGLPAITERQYLDIERGFKEQLRQFNLTGVLGLGGEEAFREFASEMIGKDVSVTELNRRFDHTVALSRDSSQFVQQAFQEFYSVAT